MNQPPSSIESEKVILGTILLYPETHWQVVEAIGSGDFYRSGHKIIFDALNYLVLEQSVIDIVSLSNILKRKDRLDKVGGVIYLDNLTDIIPQKSLLNTHIIEVKKKAIARQILNICYETQELCYSEEPETIIGELENNLYSLAINSTSNDFVKVGDIMPLVFQDLEERYEKQGEVCGISTGFEQLDRITAGLNDSDLIILAARPGMGKSCLAANIMQKAAENGVSSAIFSMEMSGRQLATRMICGESHINLQAARTGQIREDQWSKLTTAAGKISEYEIYIDQMADITPAQIRAKAKRIKKTKNIGLLVIDYLGLIKIGNGSRNNEVGEITRMLKITAKELDIPVLCLCQLNRQLESRPDKRPKLSDLRDSGSIEQDADMVWFIYRDDMYNKDINNPRKGIAEIIIGKQRNGPTGTIELSFHEEHAQFENLYRGKG